MDGPKKSLFSQTKANLLGRLLGLLGEKDGLDVGQNTSLSDGDSREKLVQLLVIADSKLQVTGDDPALLVVTGSVSCQFQDLSSQIFHDCGKVHGSASTNTLGIIAFPQVTVDTSHWELQTSAAAPGLALSLSFSSFTTARHVDQCIVRTRMPK